VYGGLGKPDTKEEELRAESGQSDEQYWRGARIDHEEEWQDGGDV
jgi:hypothetical protein